MSEEFLPCPFCGGSPYVIIDNYKGVNLHKFCCSLCDATTNSWNTHRDVAASCWNTRHNPAPQNAACPICTGCGLVWDHGADAGPGLPCDCAAGDRFRPKSQNAERTMESHYRDALVGIAYSDDDDETESPKLIAKRALESSPFEVFVKELQNAEDIKFALRWLNTEPNAPKHFTKTGNDEAKSIIRAALEATPQNAEADNIRPSVQAAVDKISQSNSGSDYKSEIIGDLTILHRDDPHSNAEVLEAQPLENEGDFATPLDCLDALLNIALYGNHAKDLKECAYREIATIRAALKAAPKNWLEAQLEEARKDYETWPDWKKKCSRTGEFIRNRDASKDGGE